MKLPYTLSEIENKPLAFFTAISISAVIFLFFEFKSSFETQLENQQKTIEKLDRKVEEYEESLKEVNKRLIECITLREQQQ